jgi:probable phosphoglycerate mutase
MLTLHLIRHGETEASGEGIFCGDLDPPLTPEGLEQADALVALTRPLKLTAVHVSPKLRARQTAEPTCRALGLAPQIHEGLREINYGAWEGGQEATVKASDPARFAAWVSDPAIHAPPGGESGFAIAARAVAVIEQIRADGAHGNVAIFSHKATIRVLVCALLGLPIGRFRDRIACPTASVTSFEYAARGPMLVQIGQRA